MPVSICPCCGSDQYWSWEEAFDKFGFMDGDGHVKTPDVESVLVKAGYDVDVLQWGLHNTVIASIKCDGVEFIQHDDPNIDFGYDGPRDYLPTAIVDLLDRELSE